MQGEEVAPKDSETERNNNEEKKVVIKTEAVILDKQGLGKILTTILLVILVNVF